MSTLKDDSIKAQVVKLDGDGWTSRQISDYLNLPKSTVGDFLRKETYQGWWALNEDTPQQDEEVSIEEDIENLCESSDVDVANLAKRLRTAQKTNTQLRRAMNGAADVVSHIPEMVEAVKKATSNLQQTTSTLHELTIDTKTEEVIYEVLLSDYQIGKKGQHYDSNLAEKAMKRYGDELLDVIKNNPNPIKKFVVAILGDLVEDHMKHGVQSATSTDSGLSEQMARAIEHLWKYIIQPLASFRVPMEVICIAGNHGSSQHKGMDMYKAGLYSYDYVIYKSLEGYCEVSGYDNVTFIIPEGCFGYTDIFGRYAVYEHGYFNTCTEKSLGDQCSKRANQLKRHVEYFRCGDMHHVCNYDNGKLVVNGAFFGVDTAGEEYSGILGFSSIPAQVMFVHKDDKSLGRNTIKETYTIQVADGY